MRKFMIATTAVGLISMTVWVSDAYAGHKGGHNPATGVGQSKSDDAQPPGQLAKDEEAGPAKTHAPGQTKK